MFNFSFYIIDSIETNNFNDPNVLERIQGVWMSSHRKLSGYSGNIFGVYHKYSSDYKGDYTLSVATDSLYFNDVEPITSEGSYVVFKVKDNLQENILAEWQKIWKLEEEKKIHRAYAVDFEKYAPNGEIEIFISVI